FSSRRRHTRSTRDWSSDVCSSDLSVDYFNQAIEKDPTYALAYVGLADANIVIPFFSVGSAQDCYPRAKAAAKRALEIDDQLAEEIGRASCRERAEGRVEGREWKEQ